MEALFSIQELVDKVIDFVDILADDASLRKEKTYINKLNLSLVQASSSREKPLVAHRVWNRF